MKAQEIIESAKKPFARRDLLKIAALPLSPYHLEKLGVREEIDQIQWEAYRKLLKAGFKKEELDSAFFCEMVELAFMGEFE